MAYKKPDDYVEVQDRILEFRKKYPEGRLETNKVQVFPNVPVFNKDGSSAGHQSYVMVQVAAYRDQEDTTPAKAVAWEPLPGRTPYTKESELMNAETSAWGRVLIALGAADAKKGIASANEVRNREESDAQANEAVPPRNRRSAVERTKPKDGPPPDPWATDAAVDLTGLGKVDLKDLQEQIDLIDDVQVLREWYGDITTSLAANLITPQSADAAHEAISKKAATLG